MFDHYDLLLRVVPKMLLQFRTDMVKLLKNGNKKLFISRN